MKLVYGVGINKTVSESNSKFYKTWKNMLKRCYSEKLHQEQPTYIGCSVCEEWLTFSNFKTWMETQDYEGKQLDKDLLVPGNKVYSPETCVFVSQELNLFLIDSKASRGQYPIGVSLYKPTNKFKSQCRIEGKVVFLGYFDNEIDAYEAWRIKKLEIAKRFALKEKDKRIAESIVVRYS